MRARVAGNGSNPDRPQLDAGWQFIVCNGLGSDDPVVTV